MKKMNRLAKYAFGLALMGAWLLWPQQSKAYVEAPYALGRLILESTHIVLVKCEKTDNEKNLIIYRKVKDIKGVHPAEVIKHNIGKAGFHPREAQYTMAAVTPGKLALFFHNGSASETCVENYWYQTYPGGEWWNMSHGEPYLMRTFYGKPEKLADIVTQIVAGKEVATTCMVDGDKNAIQLRQARLQRMKASLKIQDYDPKRDFLGWGGDEFRRVTGMPAFTLYGAVTRTDPGAWGATAADVNGTAQQSLLLYGEDKSALLVPNANGNSMDEATLPYTAGARAASFADFNSDGKADILLATPTGPKLLVNLGGGQWRDDSALLPQEPYWNLTGAAAADFDGDGKPDILLANGFFGLRLYRNVMASPGAAPAAKPATPAPARQFEDVSISVGIGPVGIGSNVKGDRLLVADFNGDGRQDVIYCAGTGMLLLNTPQGFVESKDHGLNFKTGRVAPAIGDFAGDKTIGLFVPQTGGSKLYRNDGKGHFTDVTAKSGDLAKLNGIATSAAFANFYGAGRQDLIVGCVRGYNRIYRNNGNGTFTDTTDEAGLSQKVFNTRGITAFDMNKDGVIDLAFNNEGQESCVLVGTPARVRKQ